MAFFGTYASPTDFPQPGLTQRLINFLNDHPTPSFLAPQGIAILPDNTLLIGDTGRHAILAIHMARQTERPLLSAQAGFNPPAHPTDISAGSNGDFYFIDRACGRVIHATEASRDLRYIGTPTEIPAPHRLAFDPIRSLLYVSDSVRKGVLVFSGEGTYLGIIGGDPSTPLFGEPAGMAIDQEGNLYIADPATGAIGVFDAKGQLVDRFGSETKTGVRLQQPVDLVIDRKGHLHILDQGLYAIITCTLKGEHLLTTGTGRPSHAPLGLLRPMSIAVDREDRLYIVDAGNRRLSIWQCLHGGKETLLTRREQGSSKSATARLQRERSLR